MGKSGSCPDVSSECTHADPLHKLSYISTWLYICTIFPKNN